MIKNPLFKKKIAVFGGSGFLGTSLTELLTSSGSFVTVFSRSRYKEENSSLKNIKIIYDQDYPSRIDEILKKNDFDAVINCVGKHPALSDSNPIHDLVSNQEFPLRILEACKRKKSKPKLVFFGSRLELDFLIKKPHNPLSVHSIHKYSVFHYARYYSEHFGQKILLLRLAPTYGKNTLPFGKSNGIINKLIDNALIESKIKIYGDRDQVRNFLHINDVFDLIKMRFLSKRRLETFNVGGPQTISFFELANIIKKHTQASIQFQPLPQVFKFIKSDSEIVECSVPKWKPKISIKSSLPEIIQFRRKFLGK